MTGAPRIKCDHCKELVSIEARKCPHCGGGLTTKGWFVGMMIATPFITAIALVFGSVVMSLISPFLALDIPWLWVYVIAVGLFEVAFYVGYRDRKQKVAEAYEEASEDVSDIDDASGGSTTPSASQDDPDTVSATSHTDTSPGTEDGNELTFEELVPWIFGSVFILMGGLWLSIEPVSGTLMLLTGGFTLPITRELLSRRLDLEIEGWVVASVLVAGFALSTAAFYLLYP